MYKLILFFMLSFPTLALAEEEMAKAWRLAAKGVCDQIDHAVLLYKQGDLKGAKLTAIMAYFKGYDAEIEPAVRTTLGGEHVFAVEHQFRDLSTAMVPNPGPALLTAIDKQGKQLCATVYADANALSAANVKPDAT